ncbi:MAG: hypothetical protein M1817_000061 [Caeruleum heppii]|nr:MAG: hypothetical protein M1817_000061 [Caeruleum heppii]
MPFERQNTDGITSKEKSAPRPPLSRFGTASKPSRPPLTPRLATSLASTASSTTKHGAKTDPVFHQRAVAADASTTTPVKAFLNSNITPRSSSRKARAGSAGSTPTRTPNDFPDNVQSPSPPIAPSLEPNASRSPLAEGGHQSLKNRPVSLLSDGGLTASTPDFLPGTFRHGSARPPAASDGGYGDASPKFFFASEVGSSKAGVDSPLSRPALASKTPSFVYANGTDLPVERGSSLDSPTLPSYVAMAAGSGTYQRTRSPSPTLPDALAHTVLLANAHAPCLAKETPALPSSVALQNPPCPAGAWLPLPNLTGDHPSEQTSQCSTHSRIAGRHTGLDRSCPSNTHFRILGTDSQLVNADAGEHDTVRIDGTDTTRGMSEVTAAVPPYQLNNADGDDPLGPPCHSAESVVAHHDGGNVDDKVQSHPQQYGPDSAANARRERKLLDLEISNSSLMAINRALEREMRKQNAELRRFRRLSRSGRLSLASASVRSSIDHLPTVTETGDDASGGETWPGGESDNCSSEGPSEDDCMSPESLAESDERRSAKDERILRLDLSKHQELLIDSQRLNQSLKRCLGWTEELIIEGKKALDYRVRVSEVELGGRVLTFDEVKDGNDLCDPVAVSGLLSTQTRVS